MASPVTRYKFLIFCFGLLLFLITVCAGPTGFSRANPQSCAPICNAIDTPLKFQYDVGTTYVYEFTSDLETLVLEETAEKSRLRLTASVELQAISSCDFSIELKNVGIEDGVGGQRLNTESVENALKKHSLRFSFQDGQIDHICSDLDEPGWVLNVKRGILSMFQNTMENLNFEGIVSETDINGKCLTQYGHSVSPSWGGSNSVSKFKDLSTCSNRKYHFSFIQSEPYVMNPETSILSGTVECTQTILQKKIERVECQEEQIFKPFQENNSGARNVISQILRLVTTRPASAKPQEYGPRRKSSTLVFEMDTLSTETDKDTSRALKLLRDLSSRTEPNVGADASFMFRDLVDALRMLDESSLRSIHQKVSNDGMEKIFLNGLSLANTAPSLTLMTQLYITKGISDDIAESWLSGVTFIKHPTPAMISALMPLLRSRPNTEILLSVSGVMNSYCKNKVVDCSQDSVMLEAMQLIGAPLHESECIFPEDDPGVRVAVVALKSIGNLGIYIDPTKGQLLEKCFLKKNNAIPVRLAAMEAHRRISCSSFSTTPFLNVYGDYEEDTEIRIQAYLISMKCANRKVLETVENILMNEVVNQVGSFVWTHLTNIQETNRRDKDAIRNLVSNEILQNKFQTDARKFSRNYESSMFSDEYKIGAGLDANVIFTEESFLPKSAMANFSVQLFGETINILEIGGRFHSPESLLEPIFGPGGYFPDESMATFLQSTRQKRDTTSNNKLTRLSSIHDAAASNLDNSPGGSIYTRFFGHEVTYKEFEVNTESAIPNVVDEDGKKWLNVKNILDNLSTGKKLGVTKSNILMDVDYSVPTISGIPLTLTFLMGSTVGLTAEGRFNVGKFIERKEVEIYGLLRPNLALNLDASLTVRLGPNNKNIRSGLSVRNVIRSSTAIETKLNINGVQGVKAIVNLPQSRQEILEVSSKVVFLQPSRNEKILDSNAGGPKIQHKTCFGDHSSNFLGLKLCGEISVPKHFTVTPRSLATMRLYLEKTDEFIGYTIDYGLERRPTKTQLTLVYDTPGSKLDRRASLNFILHDSGTFQAAVKTPAKLLDARGAFSSDLKNLDVTIIDGNETLVQLNTSLVSVRNKISSSFFLAMFRKPIADMKGSIELPNFENGGKNGNVDFILKHVTKNPIRFQGNYIGKEDGSEITLGVESYYFTGNLRSNIKSRPNHWSSRSMLEYSWKHGDISTIDISAKLQKSQKGALLKLSTAASFIMSKYPDHSIDFSWETQASQGFCENIAKFVIGKSTWDAHSIYNLQNTRDLTELRLLLSLSNPREDVDYYFEFAHKLLDRSVNTKFVGRISPENEINAKFRYDSMFKPFMVNNLTASVTWPGHEYSVNSALVEKRKGEFDGEIWININSLREMKATISYINNSNNLKLDHLVEFRARGFFFAPVSGNIGFTVTDKQSHIGCQILIEGKKPYSSRLSTSIDYSHIRNTHKIEAKVTLNEKKYSSELLFGQTKNGSKHVTVDLFLNQHIFLEAKTAGSFLETITASILVIPDKEKPPREKFELFGTLSPKTVNLGLNHFGDKFGLTGAFGDENANLEVTWGQGKKISALGKLSSMNSLVGHMSLQLTTPFEDFKNLTLFWNHEISSERWSGKLSGGFGQKILLLQLTAGMNPQDTKLFGILHVSGYSKCEINLALHKSENRNSLLASFSRGVMENSLQIEHNHGRNVSGLSIQLKGLKSVPEIYASWDSQQIGKHYSKFLLDWGNSGQSKKNSLHFHLEKNFNPISYHASLVTPLSAWNSSSGHLVLDHVTPVYTFNMKNEASLAILPKKIFLAVTGTASTSFNHSAEIQFSQDYMEWSVFGHTRALDDTNFNAQLKTPFHSYKTRLRSESENGIRILEVITDIDTQKSELGVVLRNDAVELEKNEIRAWGSYFSGPEKKATLLLRRDSQMRKLSLEVSEDDKSLLQLESDFIWTGFKFWSVSCQLTSTIPAIPSLSLESSHNMLDSSKIVNVNSFVVSPTPNSFWDVSGFLPIRNMSTQTVLTNFETFYSSLKWDTEEVTVAGELIDNDFGFIISSTSFEPINGNVSYDYRENSVMLSAIVSSSSQKILDALIKASRSSMGNKFDLVGSWNAKYFPRLESKLSFDRSIGMIETFLTSDEETVFFLHVEGQATTRQGFLKFKSRSSFYPSINDLKFDTLYKIGDNNDDGHMEVKYVKQSLIHHIKLDAAWREDNRRLRLTSTGQFIAGLEISLENFNNVLAVATFEGKKLGEFRIRYESKISTYAWGHHLIFMEFINGQGSSSNASISFSGDPKKVDVIISTPFESWSELRVYWDIDISTTITKMAKFGVHKDGDKLDCLFDLKFSKRNETTVVKSEIGILGFKSLRRLLFIGIEEDEDSSRKPYLNTLTAVEGTFSAFAKWSLSSIELQFKTPLERWKDLKFAGKYENKRSLVTFGVSCDINERHHEFKGTLKMGQTRMDLDFLVQCLQPYKGKLGLDYSKVGKLDLDFQGPNLRWVINGEWTKDAITLRAATPIRNWELVNLDAKHRYISSLQHDGSIRWEINKKDKFMGYKYSRQGNNHSLHLVTPAKSWDQLNITLAYDDEPLTNIKFNAERTDGQKLVVNVNTKIVGTISNISLDGSLTLDIRVESPFEQYKRMSLLTQYDRVGGEHKANIEYKRNEELLRLNGHFQYNQRSPHAVEIQVDLSSFQNYSSKVQATLSVDPNGNSSFTAVVEFNEARHEVVAALDLSNNSTIFGLETSLSFLKSLHVSFINAEKLMLHGSWEGHDQILDVKSILVGNGWNNQRLNLSIVSPFEGLQHIFLYGDFKLTPQSVRSSFLFENEYSRWLGKLEGGGIDGWNGKWNAQVNTPLKGYQDVVVKLKHDWRTPLKSLILSVEGNSVKLLDMDASLKSGEILLIFDSLILQPISTHSSIKWEESPVTMKMSASVGENDNKMHLEANIQGLVSGNVQFRSDETFSDLSSKVAWKVDGNLRDGNAWATFTNTLLGTRSARTAWNARTWKNVKIESWLRLNETVDEMGGMGQFTVTPTAEGNYKAQLNGNWDLGDGESESLSLIAKLGQNTKSMSSSPFVYFWEIDAESTLDLFRNFHASANLTLSPQLSLQLEATHNDDHLIILDSSLDFKLPKSRFAIQLNAPKLICKPKLELFAAYDVTPERKSLEFMYQEGDYRTALETILLTPISNQEAEFRFNMSSNASSVEVRTDGRLRGSYKLEENGITQLTLELTSKKLGNWNFVGEIRPTSDFYLHIHLNNSESEPMPPFLLVASWKGNFFQGVTGRLSLILQETHINGSLSLNQDTARLSLSSSFQWAKDIELIGFFNTESTPKHFEITLRANGENFKLVGSCNMTKSWDGLGSVFITKGHLEESMALLKFGMDSDGNLAVTGSWSGHDVQVKGRIWTPTPTTTWIENGQITLSFLIGGVEKLNLQSFHKFQNDEYLLNVTSGQGTSVMFHVNTNPNYVISGNLHWDSNYRAKFLIDIKSNEFDIFISSPRTTDVAAHGLFGSDDSQTNVESFIFYDNQRSWIRLHTTSSNESVQFNVSLEVPALHQKLLTTFLIQSQNPYKSGGAVAVNVNGHQFGLSGELITTHPSDVLDDFYSSGVNQRERKLSLSFILPAHKTKKVGMEFSLRKSLQSMRNLHLNASMTLEDDLSSFLSFGYDFPPQNDQATSPNDQRLKVSIMVENYITKVFKYGASLSMNGMNFKDMEVSIVANDNSAQIGCMLNLPEVKTSLKISLSSNSKGVVNYYGFDGKGLIDPFNVMNISLSATCKDKTLGLDVMTKLGSKGFLFEGGLSSSHLSYLHHRYRFQINNSAKGSYDMELAVVQDTIRVDFTGDLAIIKDGGISANGKMTGSFGTLYGRIDYSKDIRIIEGDVHGFRLTLESPSLIAGKKVVISGNVSPKQNGLDVNLQCRTRTAIHTMTLNLVADLMDGDIKFTLLSSPQLRPINLQVSWEKKRSRLEGAVRANFEDVVNELETFLDIENLEGRIKILSPLIPSSHFDVHLKSLFSLNEIDILGDVHIREYHWRFEGALKYQNWRDAVVMFHLLTPHQSFDRVTFAMKSLEDEIHCEIYTPISGLPKAMLTIKGFRAIQLGNWHNLRPEISVGLPFGKYSLAGIYTTPNSSTPGKLRLYFEDGTSTPQEVYEINAELSPLSYFNFNMNENARVTLSLQTPIEMLPKVDFELEGKVKGRNVIQVVARGKLNNDSVTFSFHYNNDNGGPTISSKLSSPFKMYENVALSLSFDSFQRIGNGRSLHMVLENPEWVDQITLNADYRYQYTGFLTMDGELNAALDSFMDIPAFHFALQTDTEDGFSGLLNAQIGATPATLKVDMQLGEAKGTLFINGTLSGDEDMYTFVANTNLLREEELMRFSTQVSVCGENILSAHSTFSTILDATGADFYVATPWGPIQFTATLIPISPLLSDAGNQFSVQKLFENSNATLDLKFDDERLLGLQFVSWDGVGIFELFNPIAPLSLVLSLKRVSPSGFHVFGEFCWNLEQPVGNTLGGGMNWDMSLLGRQVELTLKMKEIGNLELRLSHSLTSSSLNQSAILDWNSPMFKTVGRSGYQLIISKGSVLGRNKNYDTLFQVDLPWRSLVLETSSNNKPDEYLSSLLVKWDAGRDESKSLGIKWQEEVKLMWKATEISDFLEISHPMSPLPLTISSERIFRNGRFQLVEFEMNGSDQPGNALVVSIFRNNTSWSNSKANIRHMLSNTSIALNVKTTDDTFSSELSYMGFDGSVKNLTLNVLTKDDNFDLLLYSSTMDKTMNIVMFKNHRYQSLNTFNCKFLSYDADAMFLSSLPFLEIMIKHNGEDKLNIFGGYSHKKKVGAHVATVSSESFVHFFQATAELTPTNALAAKAIWLPDLFSNLLRLKLPTEISSSIFTDIDSLGFLEGMEAEVRGRWDNQLSPKLKRSLVETKNFVQDEINLLYEEGVQLASKITSLYDNNVFYIRDIFSHFDLFTALKDNLWKAGMEAWKTIMDSTSAFISLTLSAYDNWDGRLENLVMNYWKQAEDFVELTWVENVAFASSVFNKLWDVSKILLDVLEGKIEEMEKKLMAVGFFRKLVQVYKDYATWLEEVPFQEFTRKIEAMMNIRIWDRIKYYLEPLIDAIRSGVEDQYFKDLLETPPLPFIRYGFVNVGRVATKFWEVLEVEQRLKSIVRVALSSFDKVVHRYLPTAHWSYDFDQGFIEYNQSLSAIQWMDFTQLPRWRTAAEEVQDVSQLTNFYYQALDTIESLKPVFDLNLRTILPPFGSYGLMAGDYHYFTFDKRYFRFVGECSYLLVADLSQPDDAFSLIVNYENRNGVVRKQSYSITANDSVVDIEVSDFKVSINGRKVELPLHLGTLFIRRHQTGLEMYDQRGFTMTCSLSFSVCTVGVSGWHFGKLAGILGTYDNEPINDLQSPDKQQITDVSAFAYSWRVGRNSGSCRMKNFAKDDTELIDSDNICHNLLQKRSSPLRPCFNTVDTDVFMQMCIYDVSRNVNSANRAESACPAMNAYVTECQKNKVDIWMPPTCVRCRLEDGIALTTGENATFETNGERRPPSSSDNVILIQESSCISSSIVSEAIKMLDLALQAEGLRGNRYAVVGFSGSGFHEQPHVKTISANVWAHNTLLKIPNDTSAGGEDNFHSRVDLYDAVHYAASLGFRAGVAKNFIAVTCGDEDCGDTFRYADALTLLVENDIKLHMLVPKDFTLKGNRKDEINQIYGMDMNGVYTLRQAKNGVLDSDPVLKRQINIPKDLCTPLALESNGTRFNVKTGTKRVLDVWSRRVAKTSHPSTCQRCECVPDRFGSSSIMCHQCVSPSLWKFMEEWKNYQSLDGEEFPVDLLDHSDFMIS